MNQFEEFWQKSQKTHGRILKGQYAHWCTDWDDMPIDETCMEFASCTCYSDRAPEIKAEVSAIQEQLQRQREADQLSAVEWNRAFDDAEREANQPSGGQS